MMVSRIASVCLPGLLALRSDTAGASCNETKELEGQQEAKRKTVAVGIDLGNTCCRVSVFDHEQNVVTMIPNQVPKR